jgi:membrane protein implicated in regulation of membrane protease activity
MPNSADALRRWLGAFCLAVAAGMLIWGQMVFNGHLKGIGYVLYWLVCFTFTCASIVLALLDMRAVRQRARDEQRKLIERALDQAGRPEERDESDS